MKLPSTFIPEAASEETIDGGLGLMSALDNQAPPLWLVAANPFLCLGLAQPSLAAIFPCCP